MEVVVQSPSRSPPIDPFNFSGTYLSAPSSPKRFGEFNYLSAPTSPSRISEFYSEFDYFTTTIEEAASSTNNNNNVVNVVDDDDDDNNNDGFAFFVNRELDQNSSRSAEELFHGGKIKPLKPQSNESEKNDSFASKTEQRRGRERDRATTTTVLSSSNSGRRVTRSHSPYGKSNNNWELEEKQEQPRRNNKEESTLTNTGSASISSGSNKGSSRRWRLRDFLLFRSASEGRGSSKDAFKKGEEVKGSSFRSSDSSRRKGPVSAHELHYAMKKAESQDMKKKTFLPYRQGILGRLSGFGI